MRRLAMLMIPASILLAQHLAFGQGVLVVDQQSSDESHVSEGTVGVPGQEPIQSFTPSLSGSTLFGYGFS